MKGKFKRVKEIVVAEIAHEESVVRNFINNLSNLTKRVLISLLAVYIVGSVMALSYGTKVWQKYTFIAKTLSESQSKEQEDQKLGEYVMFIMGMRETKMSNFQKQLMAQTIVRVSGNIFDNYDERTWFVILINNESSFDRLAKSPAGAVGLTQVMPQFVEEFGGHCGLSNINPLEVTDMEVNLTLGACRFKHLLVSYKGVYSTALAAYNGGKNAKSVKELQRLANITTEETLQYLARFTHIKASADANAKNNPDAVPSFVDIANFKSVYRMK
jgi:hypothetical protein